MKKIIISSLIVFIIIVSGFGIYYFYNKNDKVKDESLEKVKTSELNTEAISKTTEFINENETTTTTMKTSEKTTTLSTTKTTSKPTMKATITTTTTSSSSTKKTTTTKTTTTSSKTTNPWELYGMTEDEYYNKPMWSWARVDFKTMEECLEYGDHYEPYLNGKVLYNCMEINSMSGNFLGIMFDTEELR